MNSLADYISRATDPAKKLRIEKQWQQANDYGTILCGCGLNRALVMAFRCLYCGEWYCLPCAEKHFGQTLQEWIEAKRVRLRQGYRLEARRSAERAYPHHLKTTYGTRLSTN